MPRRPWLRLLTRCSRVVPERGTQLEQQAAGQAAWAAPARGPAQERPSEEHEADGDLDRQRHHDPEAEGLSQLVLLFAVLPVSVALLIW